MGVVSSPQTTCWTLIAGAAAGSATDRQEFARRYLPAIEAYLSARWRGGPLAAEREDAVQEAFLECFREGGALARVERERPGGFRAFLYGMARNVARRFEERRAKRRERAEEGLADEIEEDEPTLSRVFDRAWALAVLREAWGLFEAETSRGGETARRRAALLRLRFEEDLPIRDIARRWAVEAAALHEEYRLARRDFRKSLLAVVSFHRPHSAAEAEQECKDLLALFG